MSAIHPVPSRYPRAPSRSGRGRWALDGRTEWFHALFALRTSQASGVQNVAGQAAGALHQRQIASKISEAKGRKTTLIAAQQFTGASQQQIFFGDTKSVVSLFEHGETATGLGCCDVGHQDAVGLVRPASDPASELMELGEPELFGIFDHHDGGIGDVNPDLDDGGGHQNACDASPKSLHYGFLFIAGKLPVQQPYPMRSKLAAKAPVLRGDGLE
jgi:hypothetical protein